MTSKKMNIIIIGDQQVGKTSILQRFDKRQFKHNTIRTIGVEFITHKYNPGDDQNEVTVKVWDTAGQERFRNLTYQFYRQADGIIIAFDLTSAETFKNIRQWVSSIYKNNKGEIPKILVGNKCDMEDQIAVKESTAQNLADEHNMPYVQTSALSNINIDEMMQTIMKLTYDDKIVPILKELAVSESQAAHDPKPVDTFTIGAARHSTVKKQKKDGCC